MKLSTLSYLELHYILLSYWALERSQHVFLSVYDDDDNDDDNDDSDGDSDADDVDRNGVI